MARQLSRQEQHRRERIQRVNNEKEKARLSKEHDEYVAEAMLTGMSEKEAEFHWKKYSELKAGLEALFYTQSRSNLRFG